MSDNKARPTENPKPDSFLGRLSIVLSYSVLSAICCVTFNLVRDLSSESRQFHISLLIFLLLGWLVYAVIIYLSGRCSEVAHQCERASIGANNENGPFNPVRKSGWMDTLWFMFKPFIVAILFSIVFGFTFTVVKWVKEVIRD
jgi:hypothetical protein